MKEQFKTVNVGTFSELINLRQRFENFGVWTFLTEKTNKNSTLTAINCCLLMKYFAQEWMFSQKLGVMVPLSYLKWEGAQYRLNS